MLPAVSGEFRIVFDPELRFAPSGIAICNARAVASSRKKDESSGEWVDDKNCWVDLTAFKGLAENMAESIEKGMLVTLTGRLQTEEWEDRDGNKRTKFAIILNTIGPSLAFATAKVTKVGRSSGTTSKGSPAADDPWVTAPAGDEPPF